MTRPYKAEPRTHYDGNDSHHYHMHDVLDPPELNGLVDQMERENVLWIDGIRYYLAFIGKPDAFGAIPAKLRKVDEPFRVVPIADTLDLSEKPF